MQKVVILGAGPYAMELCWAFHDSNAAENRWELLGYIDDNRETHGHTIDGIPVLGGFDWFEEVDVGEVKTICSPGPTNLKPILAGKAEELGLEYCSVIHPSVEHSLCGGLGRGCYVGAGSVLGPGALLNDHVAVHTNVSVGHDTILEKFVNVSPGASLAGNIKVEEGVDVGIGASAIQGLTIGKWSIIGANAAVVKDIPEYVTAVGVPAKVIKKHRPQEV